MVYLIKIVAVAIKQKICFLVQYNNFFKKYTISLIQKINKKNCIRLSKSKNSSAMGLSNSKEKLTASIKLPVFTYQNMIKHITNVRFNQEYEVLDILGRGSYAQVRKAKSKKTGIIRAVKIIDRLKHNKIQPLLINEYDILKELDHPCIIKIFQIYQQMKNYYIVMELCEGKQLFEVLHQMKHFSEVQAFRIFYQLLSAVQYLHSRSIMHRDLKPQNIMYQPSIKILKLIDFGSACKYEGQEPQQQRRVGTTYYVAPQVIDRRYNNKCDVWSLGVILYMMLSGEPPFNGKCDQDVLASVKKGLYNFKKPIWENISPQAKMIITDMFAYNPNHRPNINQLMKSQWIKKNIQNLSFSQKSSGAMQKILCDMQKFKKTKPNSIQSAVLVFMVNFVKNFRDQAELQKSFQELDLNGDGMISMEELTSGLQNYLKISKKEAASISEAIFIRIDTNKSGLIDYSQFIVATRSMEMAATQQNISLAFDCMDKDKNGFLSAKQFQAKLGYNIQTQVYQQMLKQFKLNENGEISKKNFIAIMLKFLSN